MFFKKNYFVEFEYEGPEENGVGVVVRCLPSELIKATDEIKKTLEHMKIKVDRIFITKIKRV
ncbi:hypothetical protein [Clostridium butyricum]|uniref:hypothetical protein n=1 Tax=Clostridium butyricum TaxID=1492 RepID=UPI002ABD830C|nr:hypothetical protein [Clostridium butyricum]